MKSIPDPLFLAPPHQTMKNTLFSSKKPEIYGPANLAKKFLIKTIDRNEAIVT